MTPNSLSQRSPTKLGSPLKRALAPPPSLAVEDSGNAPEWLDLSLENLFGVPGQSPMRPNHLTSNAMAEYGFRLPSDGSEEGVDILQEFGKIGAHIGAQRYVPPSQGSPVRRPSARPPLGRSVTSRF